MFLRDALIHFVSYIFQQADDKHARLRYRLRVQGYKLLLTLTKLLSLEEESIRGKPKFAIHPDSKLINGETTRLERY